LIHYYNSSFKKFISPSLCCWSSKSWG